MNDTHDVDLKVAFNALGGQLSKSVPPFDQLTSRDALNVARWRRRRRLATMALMAVAVPAFLIYRVSNAPALDYDRFTALTGLDLSEVTWEAPSDFLLEFPGRDLLRSVPLVDIQTPVIAPDTARSPDSNTSKGRSRS
jgi:hypothetical protein